MFDNLIKKNSTNGTKQYWQIKSQTKAAPSSSEVKPAHLSASRGDTLVRWTDGFLIAAF